MWGESGQEGAKESERKERVRIDFEKSQGHTWGENKREVYPRLFLNLVMCSVSVEQSRKKKCCLSVEGWGEARNSFLRPGSKKQ